MWRRDAFAPDGDNDLPSWAGPSIYPPRQARRGPSDDRAAGRGDGINLEVAERTGVGSNGDGYRDAGYGDTGYREPGTAGPAEPVQPGSRRLGRAAATRLRKSRRRVYRISAVAIVVVILAAGGVLLFGLPKSTPLPYVTSLQKGEYKSVPNVCQAVGASVLNQFLPGPGRSQVQEQSGSADNECSFTIDRKPALLVLDVTAQEYQPFAAATGDGSATANAQDNFSQARQALARPPAKSPLEPAVIAAVPRLGQEAFSAFQPEHAAKITTDIVTVVVRERNVLITVSLSGQESGHGFGPVAESTLQAGARAAAANLLTKVRTQPTV
ncbi:MAG TPA: hypothetical protein VGI58_14075 [Streptosporangiaceae bacterium]